MAQDSTVPVLCEELMNGVFKAAPSGVADIDAHVSMYVSGDREVTIVGAADTEANIRMFIGRTIKDFKYGYDAQVTMNTQFRRLQEWVAGGTVTAGMWLRMEYSTGAIQGQLVQWTPGTDDYDQIIGMCWVGGADTETIEVLEL